MTFLHEQFVGRLQFLQTKVRASGPGEGRAYQPVEGVQRARDNTRQRDE